MITHALLMKAHQPQILAPDDHEDIRTSLDTLGYAVISVPTLDPSTIIGQFKHDLSEINDSLDPYQDKGFPAYLKEGVDYPRTQLRGLLGEYGLSQGTSAWMIRLDPTIQGLFASILSDATCEHQDPSDLVCSTDAIGFSSKITPLTLQRQRQSQNNPDDPPPARRWLHVDQAIDIPGSEIASYQGIYYAHSVNGLSGAGTVVVPGSHLEHHMHNWGHPLTTRHFHIVDQDVYWDRAVKLDIPAGNILIYNSKLVHQGWDGISRLCYMVSYGLASDRTESTRVRKIMMYLGGHRSTHWSQYGVYHGLKWRHGENWNLLEPRLSASITKDGRAIASLLLEEEKTTEEMYSPDMDEYIPPEILGLM